MRYPRVVVRCRRCLGWRRTRRGLDRRVLERHRLHPRDSALRRHVRTMRRLCLGPAVHAAWPVALRLGARTLRAMRSRCGLPPSWRGMPTDIPRMRSFLHERPRLPAQRTAVQSASWALRRLYRRRRLHRWNRADASAADLRSGHRSVRAVHVEPSVSERSNLRSYDGSLCGLSVERRLRPGRGL